jgi:hypothetical protein
MKFIIAGSRNSRINVNALSAFNISEVVSGHSGKIDLAGEAWAKSQDIPIIYFSPDWRLGKKAGPLRNREMAKYADALIAFWDGKSRGTYSMIHEMRKIKKPYYIFKV